MYVIVCISTAKKKHTVYHIIYLSTSRHIYIYINVYIYIYILMYIYLYIYICRQLLHFMTCNPILKLIAFLKDIISYVTIVNGT